MEREELISLVTKAQNGDDSALSQLFDRYYTDLYRFALKTLRDSDLAFDITQEAFIEIINSINSLKEPAAFVTWAKQITYHQCTRYFKKKKDVIVDEDENGHTVFDELKEEKEEFLPGEILEKDDLKKSLISLLDDLSEEQRAAVILHYFDNLSVKDIAKIQGVSEGTVKSRLNYARKALKASVEDYEKNNNIKFRAIPLFPLFFWAISGQITKEPTTAAVSNIAKGISTATGRGIVTKKAVSNTASALSNTAKEAAGSAAKAATKSGISLGVKIATAIIATAVLITSGFIIFKNMGGDKDDVSSKEPQSSSFSAYNDKQSSAPENSAPEAEIPSVSPIETDFINFKAEMIAYAKGITRTADEIIESSGGSDYKEIYYLGEDFKEKFNLLGYDIPLKDNNFKITKGLELGSPYTRLELDYSFEIKDKDVGLQLLLRDISNFNSLMKINFNGKNILPEFKPTFSEYAKKRFLEGEELGTIYYETYSGNGGSFLGETDGGNIGIKLTENDRKLFYNASLSLTFYEEKEGDTWHISYLKNIN